MSAGQGHDLAAVRRWLDDHPFNRWLGIEVVALAPGRVMFRLEVQPQMRYVAGIVHGGVTAMLLDTALGVAARLTAADTATIRTKELLIRYVAAGTGTACLVEAAASPSGREIRSTGQVRMEGRVVAEAQGRFAVLPRGGTRIEKGSR